MSIFVTGTTDRPGGLVGAGQLAVDALIQRGAEPAEIIAGGGDVELLRDLATRGVRTANLDFDDLSALRAAFDGVQKLLLVAVPGNDRRVRQHQNAIGAAKVVGVEQVVYTSWTHADVSTLHSEHFITEQALKRSGLAHVILRNSVYFEFHTSWIPLWREAGQIIGAAGGGRVSGASRADLADAAAAVLTSTGHDGFIYELGGNDSYSMSEFAAELSRQTCEAIPYVDVSLEEFELNLRTGGLHDAQVKHLVAVQRAIAANELFEESGHLSQLVNRPLSSLSDAIANALSSPLASPKLPPIRSPEQPFAP